MVFVSRIVVELEERSTRISDVWRPTYPGKYRSALAFQFHEVYVN